MRLEDHIYYVRYVVRRNLISDSVLRNVLGAGELHVSFPFETSWNTPASCMP